MRNNHDFNSSRRPADRRRGRGHEFGREFGADFGREFGGPGRPRGRRRGGRGGDVRAAALLLLTEQPLHGYQLIQEIAERSEGAWKPSPGSIYPVLQQLEDEGFLTFERVDGRKTATLTVDGQSYVEEHRDAFGTPWDEAKASRGGAEARAMSASLKGLFMAGRQVAQTGTPAQKEQATAILDDARKAMYRILAEDESAS